MSLSSIHIPERIRDAGLSMYDRISFDSGYYIPTNALEYILSQKLSGLSLAGLPLRTRSKFVKARICEALGYQIPSAFKHESPQFPGQNFDVYTQKSRNVQIWNQSIDANRRYVFIGVDCNDTIRRVRIIDGQMLAQFDTTGRLTRKYQAIMKPYPTSFHSEFDTSAVRRWKMNTVGVDFSPQKEMPNYRPYGETFLSVSEIFRQLVPLVGQRLRYLDAVQERNRGAELHARICRCLGYSAYEDDGTYPDITNQLLEIKLQTSPTIDLGLHSPTEDTPLNALGKRLPFCSKDVRYAIFDATAKEGFVILEKLYLVTGEEFFKYFPLFKGKGANSKLQIPLPPDFFDGRPQLPD